MIITLSLLIDALYYTDDGWLPASVIICMVEPIISSHSHRSAVVITSVYCKDLKKLCNYISMKMFCSCQP